MPDGIRRKGGLQPVAPQTPKTGAPGSDVGRRQKRQGVTPELRTGLRDGARRGESLIRPSGPKPTDTNVDVMIAELAQLDLSSLRPQPGQPRPRRRLSGAAWSALLTDEPCHLTNVPAIEDVEIMLELVRRLGRKTVEEAKSCRD